MTDLRKAIESIEKLREDPDKLLRLNPTTSIVYSMGSPGIDQEKAGELIRRSMRPCYTSNPPKEALEDN